MLSLWSYGSLGPQLALKEGNMSDLNVSSPFCPKAASGCIPIISTCILQASENRPKLMLPTVDFECKVADEQLATVVY